MNVTKKKTDFQTFQEYMRLQGLALPTASNYAYEVARFFSVCEFFTRLNVVTFLKSKLNDGHTTRIAYLKIFDALKKYDEAVHKCQVMDGIPRIKRMKTIRPLIDYEAAYNFFTKSDDDDYHNFFLLMLLLGLRISEAANLKIVNIDFERKTAFIKNAKNSKDRIVPISKMALPWIEKFFKRSSGRFLIEHNEKQIDIREAQRRFRGVAAHKSFDILAKPHDLRHSFATYCIQKGVSVYALSRALGHSDIRTTQKYVHITEQFYNTEFDKI